MESKDRLKKAIDYLKSNDKTLNNELISNNLKYRSKNYVTDLTGGTKPINKIFLNKLKNEYSINPEWILTGNGVMVLPPDKKRGKKSNGGLIDNTNIGLQDYIDEKEARRAESQKHADEFKDQCNKLLNLLNSNLNDLLRGQQTIYAFVRAALDYQALVASGGNVQKYEDDLGSLDNEILSGVQVDLKQDNALSLRKKHNG